MLDRSCPFIIMCSFYLFAECGVTTESMWLYNLLWQISNDLTYLFANVFFSLGKRVQQIVVSNFLGKKEKRKKKEFHVLVMLLATEKSIAMILHIFVCQLPFFLG